MGVLLLFFFRRFFFAATEAEMDTERRPVCDAIVCRKWLSSSSCLAWKHMSSWVLRRRMSSQAYTMDPAGLVEEGDYGEIRMHWWWVNVGGSRAGDRNDDLVVSNRIIKKRALKHARLWVSVRMRELSVVCGELGGLTWACARTTIIKHLTAVAHSLVVRV